MDRSKGLSWAPSLLRWGVLTVCAACVLPLSALAAPAKGPAKKPAVVAKHGAVGAKTAVTHKGARPVAVARKGAAPVRLSTVPSGTWRVNAPTKGARFAAAPRTRLVYAQGKHGRYVARAVPVLPAEPPRLSFGQMAGLHATHDDLDLRSSVAFVLDQDTREVLVSKNDKAVLPIASITKLMTGLLISEARLPMSELVAITQDDVDTEKGTRSRLTVGTTLTRGELLHLALMSSENRAAHALGRTYPGGMDRFVQLMNQRAQQLGMRDTLYVEPTGLSSRNQSSARDLATLVGVASGDSLLRNLSTSPEYQVAVGNRVLQFNNTNRLVKNPTWDIGLQKTGYISEAGQCLVMQARVAGRKLIMVFLDSAGKLSRLGDAERVRRWLESGSVASTTATMNPRT